MSRSPIASLALAAALISALSQTGCSSAPRDERGVKKLVPLSLKVRRPKGTGADPKAGPGGVDYRSDPLPNERFDCEALGSLLAGTDLRRVRECFASIREPATVLYRLRREAAPRLMLDDPEKAPECLRDALPELAVPREIIYQAYSPPPTQGALYCYSSRLDIEADELAGVKVPKARFALEARFPMEKPPKNDDETRRLLGAWALTPYFGAEEKSSEMRAKIVPDALCARCLGEKGMLRLEDHPEPTLWP